MQNIVRTAGLGAAIAAVLMIASPAMARPWGGHHWGGRHFGHFGTGAAIGFATGALIGGALASPYYYGGPYDGGPYYAYEPGYASGGSEQYCMQRFKSYDPASGTYLGYDGVRHPCP